MDSTEISLTEEQARRADEHAAVVDAEAKGRRETRPGLKKTTRASDNLGYRAQAAFCAWMGIPFAPQDARGGRQNVGRRYKVRGAQRYPGNQTPDLKVYEQDRDYLVFVHVTTKGGATFRLEGWISGAEAKQKGVLKDYAAIGKAAFCVATEHLHPMSTLPVGMSRSA